MSKLEKVAVFVDGSNFYHKIKDKEIGLENSVRFNYRKFANWLALDRNIVFCGYYIGVVKAKVNDHRAQNLRINQQKLFSHLTSREQNFTIKQGFMMKSGGVFHEKGVDVHMATDLLVGAYENLWDTAILVSSDTDLIPAVEKLKSLKKKIEYIGFAHKPSFGLQKCATLSRLLIKEEVLQFGTTNKKQKPRFLGRG